MLDKTYWYIEGRVIVTQYSGYVMPEDMQSGVRNADEQIKTAGLEPGVHIIVDVSRATGQHPDVTNIRKLREWAIPLAENPLAVSRILINPHQIPIVKTVANILGRVVSPRTYMVTSWDAALRKLHNLDPSLHELLSIEQR